MHTIRLYPHADGLLAFDLKEILAALGPNGLLLFWTVGDVPSAREAFDATGEGGDALEKLAASGERVSGSHLTQIAKDVRQVIWGEFKGYVDMAAVTPHVEVAAIDSSWWEIRSADPPLLDRIAAFFDRVERL